MNSKANIILSMLLSLLIFNFAYGQRSYDPKSVNVTRWLDTTTSPITYEQYNASRHFAPTANIKAIAKPTITDDRLIDIIVNEDLYPEISGVLDTFMLDLRTEGYSINLYTALEAQSAIELRQLLYNDWAAQAIAGVIFIGDLATPWYEMDEPDDWGGEHVSFPCDLYFMDLDGIWGDTDSDGMFDSHTGDYLYADIWCGRLKSSILSYHNADEVTALQNYFRKNHRYRTGELRLQDHALAFIDNDWNTSGWGFDVALSYPSTDSVVDIYETNRSNYISHLRSDSNNQYEHVLICSHSSPFAHYLFYDESNYQLFQNYEIENFKMQALTYNLFACSNSRYVENDNMGAWYIFETEYGLLSLGSSKTGSMLCFEDFYNPLGEGLTYGESFLYWAQTDIETCADDQSRAWFYGMCIQGDPTIKVARFQQPLQYCQYFPGDINGDDSVIGSDITYGVQYFRGIGAPPPDSCYNDSTEQWLYVAADANGNCQFLGSDITYMVCYFRGLHDSVDHCPDFPVE